MKLDSLSAREREIATLVSQGLSNPRIAEHLMIKVATVKRHLVNIYCKLGFPQADGPWHIRVLLAKTMLENRHPFETGLDQGTLS